jgi:hypothetical protein
MLPWAGFIFRRIAMKLFSDYLDRHITKKIGLVLISSSLILHGCAHHTPEQDPAQEGNPEVIQGGSGGTHWWYFHSGGGYVGGPGFAPGGHSGGVVVSGGGRSGGFTSSPSVSARGGFGAAGHAFGGSGA